MKRAKYIRFKVSDGSSVVMDVNSIGLLKYTSNPSSEYVNTRFALHIYSIGSDKNISVSFNSNKELMDVYDTICNMLKVTDV